MIELRLLMGKLRSVSIGRIARRKDTGLSTHHLVHRLASFLAPRGDPGRLDILPRRLPCLMGAFWRTVYLLSLRNALVKCATAYKVTLRLLLQGQALVLLLLRRKMASSLVLDVADVGVRCGLVARLGM